jgi:hypothetical protein
VLLDTGHVPGFALAPSAWFDPLTPHDEDVFRMAYATVEARKDSRAVAAAAIEAASRAGSLRTLSDDERTRLRTALADARTAQAESLGAEAVALLALIERGRAEFAAGR